ncbi:MAG TPA: hypothetical protein VED67_03260 [Thermodesulfovibrionales bacterium]|nr:hypothetical protein [Thermodesulfovibrionales bacterium]
MFFAARFISVVEHPVFPLSRSFTGDYGDQSTDFLDFQQVITTHDRTGAERLAVQLLVMNGGRITGECLSVWRIVLEGLSQFSMV